MNHEQRLKLISQAWGRKLDDTFYCFFPYIDRQEQAAAGTRRAGYHEGPAFEWPTDRKRILDHMAAHENHDLYWCPSLFEFPERKTEYAVDERALWADLDEVDPRTLDDYPPTIAWETSPDRYQALWLLNQGDIRGASWEGGENQRLTYHIGADESGWDTTQLLRVPEWTNHKLSYGKSGKQPKGKVLWDKGRRYLPDDFDDLPEIETTGGMVTDVVIDEVDRINVTEVKARIRLKLNRRIRDYLTARETSGDRSDVLWEIETSLAEAGCTVAEIVAIVRQTVWNKYEDRADEMKRLLTEATKAASKIHRKKEEEKEEKDFQREEADQVKPMRLDILLANVRQPEWLVKDILTRGAVGFIAGEPKSFKSWAGLDLALSVSTGARYLNHFDVINPGPVLYIQEEDPPVTVQDRRRKIRKDKLVPQVRLNGQHEANGSPVLEFHPAQAVPDDAPIAAVLQGGLILSEDVWQEWLDETLAAGFAARPYELTVIDTLMMTAGVIEENRAQEMTSKLFKPMKDLARKHNTALIFIHHMRKGGADTTKRGGQRMLGSVANHAWAEDSMYFTLGNTRKIEMEVESKSFEAASYVIDGVGNNKGWRPTVTRRGWEAAKEEVLKEGTAARNQQVIAALRTLGGTGTIKGITDTTPLTQASARRALNHLQKLHKVRREGRSNWYLVR